VLAPLALLNLVVGRWSAAGHFADSVKRECKVMGTCAYRVVLQRPLRFLLLHGLLEGVEQRVPEAMAAAPTSDKPRRRVGQFTGYTIVGSLPGGGSGAKLYIATPDRDVMTRNPGMPDRVVIKSFALSEGSSLPQIVRESRALECAKQLGLVFEHGMDERRFFYVMPYHAGDHLGVVIRQLHGEDSADGLGPNRLATVIRYVGDLVATLSTYHRGGLWHKDVKPENVIVHDGRAHLVDLGLVTPLRSAMTLTTHGTEYFRDPELVRQALRGVKVHQINGAKFDVYAAGAVLYFMIENTFPPHGALSRFSRKSPDALKWIVRRAMADYNHRYESADAMLADLRHVANAPDFFSVRPADLPSMSGRNVDDEPIDLGAPAVASVAAAATPVPPAMPAGPTVPAAPPRTARPKLRVVNWWTGAYAVEDPVAPSATFEKGPDRAKVEREVAANLRHDVDDLRQKVRSGAMSARRAAREQVKAARTRAKELRRRARTHRAATATRRHHAVAERQPSFTLVAIGLAAVLLFGAVAASVGLSRSSRSSERTSVVIADALPRFEDRGVPLLLVNHADDPGSHGTIAMVKKIAQRYRGRGYDVVMDDRLVDGGIGPLLVEWQETQDGDETAHDLIDAALEDELRRHRLYGLLHVTGTDARHIHDQVIRSSEDHARSRRFVHLPDVAPERPYLLVNDHPTRFDPEVARRIEEYVGRYQDAGYQVVVDDEQEASIRRAMPAGRVDADEPMPEMLQAVLARAGLGGILYVATSEGDGPARDRIMLSTFDAPDADPSVPVYAPPAPKAPSSMIEVRTGSSAEE
jgi:hypothetical protein